LSVRQVESACQGENVLTGSEASEKELPNCCDARGSLRPPT